MNKIEVLNLEKSYRSPFVMDIFKKRSFTNVLNIKKAVFKKNRIHGLVGINGSGKTTLFQILSGLVIPDCGHVLFDSHNADYNKIKIGYMNSNPRSFYWRLTGMQNLEFYSELLCIDKIKSKEIIFDLANELNLANKLHIPFRFYSSGEMQSFGLIRALLDQPDLLLLDEPTSHLDPVASRRLQNVIVRLSENHEMITILCSHDLNEIIKVCDEVSFLIDGDIHNKDSLMINDNKTSNFIIKINSSSLEAVKSENFIFEVINEVFSYLEIRILSNQPINRTIEALVKEKIEIFSVVKDIDSIYESII